MDVLPYFASSEDQGRGESDLHGVGGPLSVPDLSYHQSLSDVFIQAAEQAGFARNATSTARPSAAFGIYQVTQKQRPALQHRHRLSSPGRRAQPDVLTGALTLGLNLPEATGLSACAFAAAASNRRRAGRTRGVAVSRLGQFAAAVLMLSGIGPAPCWKMPASASGMRLSEVGRNLQDHLDICTLTRCSQPVTYDQLSELRVGCATFCIMKVRAHRTSPRPALPGHRGAGAMIGPTSRCISSRPCSTITAVIACPATAIPCTPARCARKAAATWPCARTTRPDRSPSMPTT
jgi:choline dehydrogenase